MLKKTFVLLIIASFFVIAPVKASDNTYLGKLVKQEDANTYYYINNSGQKQPIPTLDTVYQGVVLSSWGLSLSDAIAAPQNTIDSYQQGLNLTVKAGSKYLLKAPTSEEFYLVDDAAKLYQINISYYVDYPITTIPSAYFSNYQVLNQEVYKPDLTVEAIDFNERWNDLDNIITATVCNRGNVKYYRNKLTMKFAVDGASIYRHLDTMLELPVGACGKTEGMNTLTTNASIEVMADSEEDIAELKEDNNSFVKDVVYGKTEKPDLAITSASFDPATPKYSESLQADGGIAVEVTNNGSAIAIGLDSVLLNIHLLDGNDNMLGLVGSKNMSEHSTLKTGEKYTYALRSDIIPNFHAFKFNFNTVKIKSSVDPTGVLDESDENNNTSVNGFDLQGAPSSQEQEQAPTSTPVSTSTPPKTDTKIPVITVNAKAEKEAKKRFLKIYKRVADMSDAKDKAAVNFMAYGTKLKAGSRDLKKEMAGLKTYRFVFKKNPKTAADWNAVRAISYSGAVKKADKDKDGLADETEKKLGTNPKKADTDGDGIKDGTEVLNGTNPKKK